MDKQKYTFTLILFLISIVAIAQVETVFNDIHFGESLSDVKLKTSRISKKQLVISPENITFPLSKEKEQHLICSNVNINHKILKQVAFVFADDGLAYIEIRGNAIKTILDSRSDEVINYLDYKVYFKDLLFGNTNDDIVWMLTPEGAHVSLFTWHNPYLDNTIVPNYNESVEIPKFLKLGNRIEDLQPIFEDISSLTKVEKLDGSDPNADLQIICFGIEYAGFPRKIEARFGDGILNAVWILTGKAEENRIRQKLIHTFGKPLLITDEYDVFNNWKIFLRKDKPEILLLNETLIPMYKKFLLKEKQ